PKAEMKLRQKVVVGEKAFDAMALAAARVEDQDGRCPVDVKASHGLGMLLHVETRGDELVVDEPLDARVGIHLGFQPSASPSHWCGGEIEQQRLAALFGLGQRLSGI